MIKVRELSIVGGSYSNSWHTFTDVLFDDFYISSCPGCGIELTFSCFKWTNILDHNIYVLSCNCCGERLV